MATGCAATCRATGHVSVARLAGRQEELETKVLGNRRAVRAAAVRTLDDGATDSLALRICGNGGGGGGGGGGARGGGGVGGPSCARSRIRSQIESRSGTISGSSRTGGSPRVGTTKERGLTTIDRTSINDHRAIHGQHSFLLRYGRCGEEDKTKHGHRDDRDGKADGWCEGTTRAILPRGNRICLVLDPGGWDGRVSGLLVTNRDDRHRGNDRQPYGLMQSSGLKLPAVKSSFEGRSVLCHSHKFGGSYERRRWRRDPIPWRGVRRKGRCVKTSSSLDGDGDGIPFLGGPRQRRRLI
ncbi:hypothetical protein CBR_g20343 [Chara braunii]|uniref:Uncharacterized protein n=1 Tax=Chara braunii TaxID=69332 RepID=A0A388L085_CHABU|nr:hypothetical protein CBR_g20343 [Chara braunii]|eukprot:GBG75720.1 hypothetical protein CBR_g20343 [Chara braunii]